MLHSDTVSAIWSYTVASEQTSGSSHETYVLIVSIGCDSASLSELENIAFICTFSYTMGFFLLPNNEHTYMHCVYINC